MERIMFPIIEGKTAYQSPLLIPQKWEFCALSMTFYFIVSISTIVYLAQILRKLHLQNLRFIRTAT